MTPQELAEEIRECLQSGNPLPYLRGADLSGADLSGLDLSNARLPDADLRGANLYGANLTGAIMTGADLAQATLLRANLTDVNLLEANLTRANLRKAVLTGTDLEGANLYGATLSWATLSGVTMNWESHPLISERLLQSAGEDPRKRALAGLVAVSLDWCWDALIQRASFICLADGASGVEWAMREMAKWVKPGDDVPRQLQPYVDALGEKETPIG